MKKVIILRGLPAAGKSFTARELAGTEGVIYSTDEYFYTEVDPHNPTVYNFVPRFLAYAHTWNHRRFHASVNEGHPLIIVDNTNTTAKEFCCPYLRYAIYQDYEVEIKEPTSEWWLTIRELLKDKKSNKKELKDWAAKLAEKSLASHQVPQYAIERMMWRWESDPDIQTVLSNCELNCEWPIPVKNFSGN